MCVGEVIGVGDREDDRSSNFKVLDEGKEAKLGSKDETEEFV